MNYLIISVLIIFGTFKHTFGDLETVKDDDLVELIRNEKYLVVLFTQKNCEASQNLENELIGLREVLVEEFDAWVVKVENSQLTRLYSPSGKEPALVYFRDGIPLLYHGAANEEEILQIFTDNREPVSKELTDETFEHLTQAATGATTGDWFVMFYTADCIDCQRLQAVWEAVGARLKMFRINIARVNRATTGAATARRFNVYEVPAFILFRRGKMYRFRFEKHDFNSLASFANEAYKHMKAENIPLPKTPFDDLVALVVVYLKDYPWLWQGGIGILCIIVLDILRRIIMSSR